MRKDRGVEFLMIEILALIAACGCGSVSIVATLKMLSVCMIKLLKGGI